MKTKARLVVSKPFLDELRERTAIAALNDEVQLEAIYLQKAIEEIERLQTQVARLVKTIVQIRDDNRRWKPKRPKHN